MFLSLSRSVLAFVVALTILLAAAPVVQASPIDLSRSHGSWFDLAWSWLSGLLSAPPATAVSQPKAVPEADTTLTLTIGIYAPNSGSCLDPQGRPKPCF